MTASNEQSIQQVAEEIEKNKTAILELFKEKLRRQLVLPQELSPDKLTTKIPQHIDDLIQTLMRNSRENKPISSKKSSDAKLRDINQLLTLEILISEFVILRDVIFETLEKKGPVDVKASNIIWNFIVHSIKVSVSDFERQRILEVNDTYRSLDESDDLNKKIAAQVQASNENEMRFRTLVEGVEDYAVFTVDPTGVITSWNPGAEKMKGYNSKEAIGSHFSMLYTEDGKKRDEPLNHLHAALIEGRYRGEGLRRRKNGEEFLADVYIRPIFQAGKHLGYAKVVADVTKRNELLQSSDISHAQVIDLKHEREQRENFVLTLSHDLKGPLSVARASVELIALNLKPEEKTRRFADKAIQSIDRLNTMISNLLDANKIFAGEKLHLKLKSWDILRLARNVCEDFSMMGSKLNVTCDAQEVKGEWDGEGIRRVLENLISNAIKYGDRTKPVDVDILDLGDKACIRVHNHGDVISVDDQKSLFKQFQRAQSSLNKAHGWGIGLSLVKGITEAHGGSVEVESYPIEGTTFTVTFPKHHH